MEMQKMHDRSGLAAAKPSANNDRKLRKMSRVNARSARNGRSIMQPSGPSRTALNAAVQRAIHQLADDEPKILTDPVAVPLVEAAAPGAIAAGVETRSLGLLPGSRALTVFRLRFAEEELAKLTLEGVRQYVILGAGLDTFAYRQPPFAEALHIIEVDHPATLAWKRASLAAAGISLPPNLSWAPVDFERDALLDQLVVAGFDTARPAFFSWLGVTVYLTLPAIDNTLRFVAGLPSPSTLVLTFTVPESVLPPGTTRSSAPSSRDYRWEIGR